MNESAFNDIAICILGAGLFGAIGHFMRIPLILSYLLAGIVMGPHMGLALIQNVDQLKWVSDVGLILLMFILGMEIDIRKLRHAGKAVLLNGVFQFLGHLIIATPIFMLCGYTIGNGHYDLLYLSVLTAFSSTLIVVKILSDRSELYNLCARITIGILVIQDIWAVSFMAIQPHFDFVHLSSIFLQMGKAVALIASSWIFAKYLLPIIFNNFGKRSELMIIVALGWCFAIAEVAKYIGLSKEMGALIAGIVSAPFPYHVDVSSKISVLRDFFITLFFISIGMQIPYPSGETISLAGIIILVVLLGRVLTIYPILYFMGYGNRISLTPAINLSQLSEFSVILVAMAAANNYVSPSLLSSFIIAFVVTILISSFTIPNAHDIYGLINHLFIKIGIKDHIEIGHEPAEKSEEGPSIFVLGFDRDASSLLYEMSKRHSPDALSRILVVDNNPDWIRRLKSLGVNVRYGHIDHFDTLRSLSLENATFILCTIPDQLLKGTTNLRLLRFLRKHASPETQILVTADSIVSAREMYKQGADYVFVPRLVSATYLLDVFERMRLNKNAMKDDVIEFLEKREEVIP
ncbi:MAG: cation:proton antiporter [Oligoflexia bacterium]|nr:cation:proton antiporter [Oligoflexia bacterium]MBF0365564.1 cation:proton antiporter [Oligoflexia bacterium]